MFTAQDLQSWELPKELLLQFCEAEVNVGAIHVLPTCMPAHILGSILYIRLHAQVTQITQNDRSPAAALSMQNTLKCCPKNDIVPILGAPGQIVQVSSSR